MPDQSYGAPEVIARARQPARKITRDQQIKSLPKAATRYEVPVENCRGLLVCVWPSGTRAFVLRYVAQSGERRRLNLGAHSSAFRLADAKKRADIHRASIAKDEDPAADRTKARRSARTGESLDELFEAYTAAARIGLHGGRNKPRRESSLDHDGIVYSAYIQPRLGKRRFRQIQKSDVLGLVRELLTERKLAASTVRGALAVLRGLLAFAVSEEKIEANACAGVKVPKPPSGEKPKATKSRRLIDLDSLRAIVRALNVASIPRVDAPDHGLPIDPITALSLRLALLTGLRRAEIATARWEEIDFTKALWVVPAQRMKADRPHEIPLVESTLQVLRLIQATSAHRQSEYLFPAVGDPSKPMSPGALTYAMRRLTKHLGLPRHSPHDFRTTLRTTLGEQYRVRGQITSHLLAHAVIDGAAVTSEHYDAATYRKEKADALGDWSRHLDRLLTDRAPKEGKPRRQRVRP